MKFLYVLILVFTYLDSFNAQLPFSGGNLGNGRIVNGLKRIMSFGISDRVQGLQSRLSKGLVGDITGPATGARGNTLKSLTNTAFEDKEKAQDLPAKVVHSLRDGITAGLDGLNNNIDKGVVKGITSFAQETKKGLMKDASIGAYDQLNEMMKEITATVLDKIKEMAPLLVTKYKTAIYTALGIAAIQTAAKLYHKVSEAKQPPLRRLYDKVVMSLNN